LASLTILHSEDSFSLREEHPTAHSPILLHNTFLLCGSLSINILGYFADSIFFSGVEVSLIAFVLCVFVSRKRVDGGTARKKRLCLRSKRRCPNKNQLNVGLQVELTTTFSLGKNGLRELERTAIFLLVNKENIPSSYLMIYDM